MNVAKEQSEMDRGEGEGERERGASVEAPVSRRLGPAGASWSPFMRASLAVEILRHETHTLGDAGGATVSGPSGIIDVSHREQRAACSSRSDGINRRDR